MALEINRSNGVFTVVGELTSENTVTLKQHFESFLSEVDEIILNLDDVTYIESGGPLRWNNSTSILSKEIMAFKS